MAEKTIDAKPVYITTYGGDEIRVLTEATYFDNADGTVSGSAPGKSATLDLYVKMPNQADFDIVDSNNLYVEEVRVPGTITDPTPKTVEIYYYRVGVYDENGQFQQTTYTREIEGLQENFDRYNTNDPRRNEDGEVVPNELLNITRAANQAIAKEEGININDNKVNQTLLGQRNLNPNQQAVSDAVSEPSPINLTIASAPIRRNYGEYVYPL